MDLYPKHPRIKRSCPINDTSHIAFPCATLQLHDILDKATISFNMGRECAKSTANNIGYTLDLKYYSDSDFAKGYAQSLGYIHGINGKDKNWSKYIEPIKYNSIKSFNQLNAIYFRMMNAVNSKHTFVVSSIYKQDYIFGWLYGQYQMQWQHDTYSLEQQGFIYAQSNTKLDPCNVLHISIKFILGFCAGRGYRDYKNFEIKKIVTFSKKFDELNLSKEKCQMYYDMFYTDIGF